MLVASYVTLVGRLNRENALHEAGRRKNAGLLLAAFGVPILATAAGAWHYHVSPRRLAEDVVRYLGSAATEVLYARDLEKARELADACVVGLRVGLSSEQSWVKASGSAPRLTFDASSPGLAPLPAPPFVYESPDAPPLARLRREYHLDDVVAGAEDEYAAQLALGRWVGTRFAHRMDVRPEGYPWFDPVTVLLAAERGDAYWCEVTARLAVYSATSLGWPARIVVISRVGGARYDHAVAELWSNEFQKWFVLDPDYNHVFESGGRPLSSWELCHEGPDLARAGQLRIRPFAPAKDGVDESRDQIPYFAYAHVDLRNDWLSRRLRRGSPAGGERNTHWTARPGTPGLLTLRRREDDRASFDWPVNVVQIRAIRAVEEGDGSMSLTVGLSAYAPYFEGFEVSVDGGDWRGIEAPQCGLSLAPGPHEVAARVLTRGGPGPAGRVSLQVLPRG